MDPTQIRIVLVDDHEMFAESLARMLERQPDFALVGSGGTVADGVALVRESAPDVAIIDFNLPDGDGVTLARELRIASPSTRVLMLTGVQDQRVLIDAIDAGCSGFVTKDRALEELVNAVRMTHQGEAYVPSDLLANLLPRLGRSYRGLGTDLTPREREVLQRLADGKSNQAVAEELFLSVHTVRNHVQNILTKLNAHSKLEAVAVAAREGLLDRPT